MNRNRTDSDGCSLERNSGGWHWETVGKARLVWRNNELQIEVPRKLLGLGTEKGKLKFDFKWADNIPPSGDIIDFTTHGDVAPNGRFNYRYSE